MFTAKAKVCGLIANPIGHSMSIALHDCFNREMGEDLIYVPLQVKEDLKTAILGAYSLGIHGMNVTIPYTQDVMKYLIDIDEEARRIGAVNTLVRANGGYIGKNSDLPGLLMLLEMEGISLQNQDVVLLGAGGAAKAAAYLACQEGAKSLTIVNRSGLAAEMLKTELLSYFPEFSIVVCTLGDVEEKINQYLPHRGYLAIQATSVGMYPNSEDCIVSNPQFFEKCDVGVDIVYIPEETTFIKNFKLRGKKACNGLGMLVYQGAISWQWWTGKILSKETKERAMETLQKILNQRMNREE